MTLRNFDSSRFAARHGLGRQLGAARVVAAANGVAEGRFTAVTFRAGRLALVVPTHAERYKLQVEVPRIRRTVNEVLGEALVTHVTVRIQRPQSF